MNKVLTIAILSAFGFVFLGSATAQAANKEHKDSHSSYHNDRHNDHKDHRHDDYKKDKDRDHDRDCDDHGYGKPDPKPSPIGPIWGGNPPRKPNPVVPPVWTNRPFPIFKNPTKTVNPILASKLGNSKIVNTIHPIPGRPAPNGQIPNIGTGFNGFAGAVGGEVGSIVTGAVKGVGDVAGGVVNGVGDVLGGVAQGVGDVFGGIF